MEYADLRVLEAVARHGSMNRAAAELHTVQSNVTARIRALEEQIGTALFERNSRGVVLTAAGQRLLPYAARLGALLKEATDAARDDGTPRGALRVGSLETTAALRLPPILSAYAQAYPEVGLIVTTGTSAGLVADVLEHRLDGAFVSGPVQHPDLAEEAIFREELMLVTAPALRRMDDLDRERDLKISSSAAAALTGNIWKTCWPGAVFKPRNRLNSVHWKRSSAVSPQASESPSCQKKSSCLHGEKAGSRCMNCRPNRPASTRCSFAAARAV
jgi:DNA-binding transcriptional LysR family regulator